MQNIAGKIAEKKLRAATFSPSFFVKKENIYIYYLFLYLFIYYIYYLSQKKYFLIL